MYSSQNNLNNGNRFNYSVVPGISRQPSNNSAQTEDDVTTLSAGAIGSQRVYNKITQTPGSPVTFRQGMKKEDLKIELFLLEDSGLFEKMEAKEKMSKVVAMSSMEVKKWYVEGRASESIDANDWTEFKLKFLEFCQEQGISSIKKYREEKWSGYLQRLVDWNKSRGAEEEVIIKKLKNESFPGKYVPLLYTPGITLSVIIEIIVNYEDHEDIIQVKPMVRSFDRSEVVRKRDIKCFRCGIIGHMIKDCKVKNPNNLNMVVEQDFRSTDEESVRINENQ